ncbi:GNAT family N-acetyltransferase [Selenomonas sp.]|uniref:GNAT family N-acetyltransferase n=1 Tax=Selenomonas sp. TaxID=2053611 RepID=UPI002A74F656|nr:GNAT family N-acetyltransferase [Selenomonas sp.]MDY3297768.1 GNAT family N-acetyltransferase [Selenomonas sp.]
MAIKRPWNRAKIFQPFDALPGLRELLREKERAHEARYNANGNESQEDDDTIEIPLASDTLLDYDESNQKFQREEMTFMEFHANDEHVYLTNERGELLANADFRETAPGVFDIYHTVVLPELRGQGIASKLVAKTVEEIHRRGSKVTATCTYAKSWLERHPQAAIKNR